MQANVTLTDKLSLLVEAVTWPDDAIVAMGFDGEWASRWFHVRCLNHYTADHYLTQELPGLRGVTLTFPECVKFKPQRCIACGKPVGE